MKEAAGIRVQRLGILLSVTPFRQRPGYCGPASLKMVLDFYGVRVSEKRLVELSGCTRSAGVSADGLLMAAATFGFGGAIKDNCELRDLRHHVQKRNTPVIVDWFDFDGGHYSVVIGIDRENVYLQDPGLGHRRALKLRTFKRLWFDFPGDFVQDKDDLIVRRMLVIRPGKELQGRRQSEKRSSGASETR
ncbi:MAG: hypothetical protein CO108_11495 [Deltaproteobacteria bacterium CG_4_9_14_3_um_filter_63_12]|nr:MAG: hypothetical protein CO108_11495 [Deltaproteobacteria bacterium CG_4_9_14_3_um_filter_63_12]